MIGKRERRWKAALSQRWSPASDGSECASDRHPTYAVKLRAASIASSAALTVDKSLGSDRSEPAEQSRVISFVEIGADESP